MIIEKNRKLDKCPFRVKEGQQCYCRGDDSIDCYYKMTEMNKIYLSGFEVNYYPCWWDKSPKLIELVRGEHEI